MITTYRAFRVWGSMLNNNTLAFATIALLIHHGMLVQIKGASYGIRMRHQNQ